MLGLMSLGFALGFPSTTAITQNILSSLPDIVTRDSIEDVTNRPEAIAERRLDEQNKVQMILKRREKQNVLGSSPLIIAECLQE